jgi:hypothetical protein
MSIVKKKSGSRENVPCGGPKLRTAKALNIKVCNDIRGGIGSPSIAPQNQAHGPAPPGRLRGTKVSGKDHLWQLSRLSHYIGLGSIAILARA